MREWVKWLVAGDEMRALARYRKACALVWRWNAGIPASSETANWIQQVGEDQRGADIEQLRHRVRLVATPASGGPRDG